MSFLYKKGTIKLSLLIVSPYILFLHMRGQVKGADKGRGATNHDYAPALSSQNILYNIYIPNY